MAVVKSYHDLEVYKKAFDVSVLIHNLCKSLPKEEQYGLSSQIKRSSKSVCANIAEGFIKQRVSKAEFKRFLAIAMGSAVETRVWIEYCQKLEYFDATMSENLIEEYEIIRKMLNGLHAKS